jgi:hypothetical protein
MFNDKVRVPAPTRRNMVSERMEFGASAGLDPGALQAAADIHACPQQTQAQLRLVVARKLRDRSRPVFDRRASKTFSHTFFFTRSVTANRDDVGWRKIRRSLRRRHLGSNSTASPVFVKSNIHHLLGAIGGGLPPPNPQND